MLLCRVSSKVLKFLFFPVKMTLQNVYSLCSRIMYFGMAVIFYAFSERRLPISSSIRFFFLHFLTFLFKSYGETDVNFCCLKIPMTVLLRIISGGETHVIIPCWSIQWLSCIEKYYVCK